MVSCMGTDPHEHVICALCQTTSISCNPHFSYCKLECQQFRSLPSPFY